MLNLFNQKTARHIFNYRNRAALFVGVDLSGTNLADGYDYNAMILATPDGGNAIDPRWGQDDLSHPSPLCARKALTHGTYCVGPFWYAFFVEGTATTNLRRLDTRR